MNEPQTRLDLIDPAIRAAGWTAANGSRMLVEQSACEFAPGRGDTLLGMDPWYVAWYGGLSSVKVPREWSDGAKCDALRVSDVIVEGKSNSIRGGLGSNVYPTIAEGAFAITNQIVSAVAEISRGKAMVIPLRFEEKKRYCEIVFTWTPRPGNAEELELVVRGYVSGKRQMAVCCFLHAKGDGIKAGFAMPQHLEADRVSAFPVWRKIGARRTIRTARSRFRRPGIRAAARTAAGRSAGRSMRRSL